MENRRRLSASAISPLQTPSGARQGRRRSLCGVSLVVSENPSHWPAWLPTRTPCSQATPNVYGLQWHWHSVPTTVARPPFWHGWQWQGSNSSRYSPRARFRYSLFTEAQGTSLTSSYNGVSYKDKTSVSAQTSVRPGFSWYIHNPTGTKGKATLAFAIAALVVRMSQDFQYSPQSKTEPNPT